VTRFAYLHGFASGPLSRKGQRLRAAFAERGLELALPDLNRPSFGALSLAAMLDELDRMADGGERWGFVGSSLGGWLAARWAALHPERVERLVLLCPAFDLPARWPVILGREAMARWEEDGALPVPDGAGVPTPLHYAFFEESLAEEPRPVPPCPTLVIHGTRDDRVPIESSRRLRDAHPERVTLVEVDDGHDLLASQSLIVDRTLAFLAG
jgi:pimeloyl-ACP methyl ester carboxylesterase